MNLLQRCAMMILVTAFAAGSGACAQQQQQDPNGRYAGENRERMRQNMRQTARELGQLAADFRSFYGDLQQAVGESGLYEDMGGGNAPMGSVDISADDQEMTVHADLPGVDKKKLSVRLKGQEVLEIEGKREGPASSARDAELLKDERYKGHFLRTVQLPYKARGNKVKARYENGVLTVVIPREKTPQESVLEIPIE